MSAARDACLFFSMLQARAGTSLVSRLGGASVVEAYEMPADKFAGKFGVTDRVKALFAEVKREFRPDEVAEKLEERGTSLLTLADDDYPERLREIPDPPPALFVRGEVPEATSVAVVGARKASSLGLEAAEEIGQALGERGVCVVSGLALGIDAAAHRGALAGGGATVGVLGCGIDVVYPRQNRELFGEVGRSGAVVSEYYLGEAPLSWRFPARNRVIAGLSEAVVVVEAAERSGALITARHAMEAGRDVWAVPGPVGAPEFRGSNRLLADGAAVLWEVEEFASSFAPAVDAPTGVPNGALTLEVPTGLPAEEAEALLAVGYVPTGVDGISSASGLEMRALLSALAMLELKGYVTKDANGSFVRKTGVR